MVIADDAEVNPIVILSVLFKLIVIGLVLNGISTEDAYNPLLITWLL